jgi:hypothetical protein
MAACTTAKYSIRKTFTCTMCDFNCKTNKDVYVKLDSDEIFACKTRSIIFIFCFKSLPNPRLEFILFSHFLSWFECFLENFSLSSSAFERCRISKGKIKPKKSSAKELFTTVVLKCFEG